MSQSAEARAMRPTAILKPSKPPRRYTLEEFLRREERAKLRHEFYNGTISKVPMAIGCELQLADVYRYIKFK